MKQKIWITLATYLAYCIDKELYKAIDYLKELVRVLIEQQEKQNKCILLTNIRLTASCFEFLLVGALSSTDSAGTAVPLFAGVCGTMAPSDSSVACSMGVWLLAFPTPSRAVEA
jgi:hypothetical protein